MKRPVIDEFIQVEGTPYVENTETKESIIFFENPRSNFCVRSMLEDDVEVIAELKKLSKKEKIILRKKLEQENSENVYLLLQEMNYYEQNGERRIVGTIEIKNEDIEVDVFVQNGLSSKVFEVARKAIILRIYTLVNDLYNITKADGELVINRVTV